MDSKKCWKFVDQLVKKVTDYSTDCNCSFTSSHPSTCENNHLSNRKKQISFFEHSNDVVQSSKLVIETVEQILDLHQTFSDRKGWDTLPCQIFSLSLVQWICSG